MLEAHWCRKYSSVLSYQNAYEVRRLNSTVVRSLSFAFLQVVSLISVHYTRNRIIKITNQKIHLYTIKTKVGERT